MAKRKLKTERYEGFTIKFEKAMLQIEGYGSCSVIKATIYGRNNIYLYTLSDTTKKRAFDSAKKWINLLAYS